MFFWYQPAIRTNVIITSIFKGPAGTRVEIVDLIREKDFAASIQLGWIEIARPHVMPVIKEEITA